MQQFAVQCEFEMTYSIIAYEERVVFIMEKRDLEIDNAVITVGINFWGVISVHSYLCCSRRRE